MGAYPSEWEQYYESHLRALWDLLGAELRARTTPEAFRAWVYDFSIHEGWPGDIPIHPGMSEGESPLWDVPHPTYLWEVAGVNYLRLRRHCESHYLPLLQHHIEALESLQELCYLQIDSSENIQA